MKAAMFSVGEPSELYFSVWHETRGFLTEEYFIGLTAIGMPSDINLLGKLKTVFCDLDRADVGRGVFLVVRVYRIGALQDPNAPGHRPAAAKRRSVGAGS